MRYFLDLNHVARWVIGVVPIDVGAGYGDPVWVVALVVNLPLEGLGTKGSANPWRCDRENSLWRLLQGLA